MYVGNQNLDEHLIETKESHEELMDLPPKELQQDIISIEGVSKVYKLEGSSESVTALRDISLADQNEFYPIKKGQFVMIRGPSGGGKTTLLNLIGSIDIPTTGNIKIMGKYIDSSATDSYLSKLRLEKLGFVFQSFNLLATMTAFQNVELPLVLAGKGDKERKRRVIQLLTRVGLRDRLGHLPSELSGGEQQRVAIARALSNAPDILLLDEPTGDLDTYSTVEIMNLLLSINRFGPYGNGSEPTTCVMVTHNPDLECYADRVLYVQDGKFVKQALNEVQIPIRYEDYQAYLHESS